MKFDSSRLRGAIEGHKPRRLRGDIGEIPRLLVPGWSTIKKCRSEAFLRGFQGSRLPIWGSLGGSREGPRSEKIP
jgi:hypothetical protein